jgi:hypothetical protein
LLLERHPYRVKEMSISASRTGGGPMTAYSARL